MIRVISILVLSVSSLAPASRDSCIDRPGIVYKIAKMEGFYAKEGIHRDHNNPGSLVFVGQPGARLGRREFARFNSVAEGWIALEKDLIKKKFDQKKMARAWPWMKRR